MKILYSCHLNYHTKRNCSHQKGAKRDSLNPWLSKWERNWRLSGKIRNDKSDWLSSKHACKSKAEDEKSPDLEWCCHGRWAGAWWPASPVDLSDGKIFTTMEWLMVFVKVRLYSMVFQCFFYMWTIGVDGLSMVLGKVRAGSHKRPKYKKKHDLFNKYLGVINNL